MQGVASISGGRFFEGGDGSSVGDGRLRPLQQHQNHQSLKCPRCDSPNTKFCYYNNYNLSQPRHFCKSCRRYWTKGGVLRNVPVGGGCRKSKRSRAKNSSLENRTSSPPPAASTAIETPISSQKKLKSNSHSSSESSSLTNTASAATEAMSAPTPNMETNHLLGMQESKFSANNQSGMPHFEGGLLEQGAESGIFSDIGNLTNLITSTNEALPFSFGNISDMSPFRFCHQNYEHLEQSGIQQQKWMVGDSTGDRHPQGLKLPETPSGSSMINQTVQVDFSSALQSKGTDGASYGSLDWQGVGDQGLFDLSNTVDQTYWSQSHWTEEDSSNLYLP